MKKVSRTMVGAFLSLAVLLQAGILQAAAYDSTPIRNARNSVVRIVTQFYIAGQEASVFTGTGICVGAKGKPVQYVVTNRHVVEYFTEEVATELFAELSKKQTVSTALTEEEMLRLYLDNVDLRVFILADGKVYEVNYSKDASISEIADLALLRLDQAIDGRQPAVLGNTDDHDVLDSVFALGYPGLADIDDIANSYFAFTLEAMLSKNISSGIENISVTDGIISRLQVFTQGIQQIQHTADISGGNSGGPLVNERGEVIGVNTFQVSNQTGSVYFSIDVSEVKRFLKQNKVEWIDGNSGMDGIVTSGNFSASDHLKLSSYSGVPLQSDRIQFSSASASSVFPPQGSYSYEPSNVIRDDISLPWVENDTRTAKNSGDGIGEYLILYFSKTETISVLGVHPGFAKLSGYDVFYGNNRPRLLQFDFSDGSSAQYEFRDLNQVQYVQLSRAVTTDYVKITICSVYPSNIDEHTTCITAVHAYR